MKPLRETPTEPVDYAALTAGYGALVGGLLLAARDRDGVELQPAEMIPLGVATFTLAKLVTKDKVESWVRRPFVEETESGDRRPRGRRLRFAVGEVLTCARCTGAWASLGMLALRVNRPREASVVMTLLGAVAVNDALQASFSWLCARANAADAVRATAPGESPAASQLRPRRGGAPASYMER
jgi:uncharacterized protein DUF1360